MNPQDAPSEQQIPQTGDSSSQPQSQNSELEELILRIPDTAIIPEGATYYQGEDDARCRLIRPDGNRCKATRMRLYGLCAGHAGKGGVAKDPQANALLAATERRKRSTARMALGISGRRAAQPLQQSRIRAQMRAQDYAAAIVDAPLDDPELGSVARQTAAIRALELLYPQVTAHLEVGMPDEAEGVAAMGWQEMQVLAASLTLGQSDDA